MSVFECTLYRVHGHLKVRIFKVSFHFQLTVEEFLNITIPLWKKIIMIIILSGLKKAVNYNYSQFFNSNCPKIEGRFLIIITIQRFQLLVGSVTNL